MTAPLTDLDGLAQADLVKSGEMTPTELLDAAIARAGQVNGRLNAIVTDMADEARRYIADGQVADGPFQGVPFLLKDLFAQYKGVVTTAGSRLLKDYVPKTDSFLTERYKAAGTVIFGKTNTPEFGSLGTTEPVLFGPTRNPWHAGHSSGGSSGGGAAAVAARIVPMAHGNDGAGSIRIPASCCGLVGLKPTRGRITLGPDVGESIAGMTNEGVMTLTVRDTAVMLDATQGPAPGDPYVAPAPTEPFAQAIKRSPGKLKVALTKQSIIGTTVHPDCAAAAEDAAKLLQDLGHEVVEDAPPLDADTYQEYYRRFWPISAARSVRRLIREAGGDESLLDLVEPFNVYLFELASAVPITDHYVDILFFQAMTRTFANWMIDNDYMVWLTPTLGLPPPPLGFFDAAVHGGPTVMDRFMEFLPFTPLCNMSGQPAITLPLMWNDQGLPIGSHFIGRYGDEATLLSLAAQIEQARPWIGRKPEICAA